MALSDKAAIVGVNAKPDCKPRHIHSLDCRYRGLVMEMVDRVDTNVEELR